MTSQIICRPVKDRAELETCLEIRHKIFVEEQALFQDTDVDAYDKKAIHIAAFIHNRMIGTVRIYSEKDNVWWGGRLAVLRGHRGRAGRLLIQNAVKTVSSLGAKKFFANIQSKNIKFFRSLGWKPVGKEFELNRMPHRLMEADLGILSKGEHGKC